jgi:hypothetical protein
MATTTTNYGFDIPQSTDLVKDGATAIATLGQDIDTAMNTALGTKKAGMVLLNTTSFSAVASQSLPANTFSATYSNYRMIITLTTVATNGSINMRLRAAGSDNSSSLYQRQRLNAGSTTVQASRISNGSFFALGDYEVSSNIQIISYDIFRPFETATTAFMGMGGVGLSSTGPEIIIQTGGHNSATSFDSLTLLPDGTITGNVRVYGYNQ